MADLVGLRVKITYPHEPEYYQKTGTVVRKYPEQPFIWVVRFDDDGSEQSYHKMWFEWIGFFKRKSDALAV